ncbi:MAG: diaminopimelate epimerase [Lachnospiraceae bacterium]|nr:diaminopimelate epimerase [Lachnospiraceae bacterium]
MKFTKMHGCGNDYIYVDGSLEKIDSADKPRLAKRLSDRHFGVGGDGVIFINPSEEADFEMEMYNADGSRAEMCGNGIRCVAKYVYDKGLTKKKKITIVSAGKVKELKLAIQDKKVIFVKVNMGEPEFSAKKIQVRSAHERVINEPITLLGMEYRMTCVSMGNPHAVLFSKDLEGLAIEKLGYALENHDLFPNRTNAEFVRVIDRSTIEMRVWERGTGETLACGTGACAAAAACMVNSLTDEQVTVKLLGGDLEIFWDRSQNQMFMTGPAEFVFEGEITV